MCVRTCAWSYQPAVEKTSSQGVVEDHGLLTVDRLQNVLHGDRDVGVSVPCLLACFLTLNQKVGEGSCSSPLRDGQRLVMPAWEGQDREFNRQPEERDL